MNVVKKLLIFFIALILPIQIHASQDVSSPQFVIEKSSLSILESNVRDSAVKVRSPDRSSYGSGTYTIISRKRVVITALHVVDDNNFMVVEGRVGENVIGRVVYRSRENDIAILSVSEIRSRTPIRFRPSQRSAEDLVGENITYTGFPNEHDLLTVRGSVAGVEGKRLILQSYTWMGASGAGVFDQFGNYLGILVAVDIGTFRERPQVIENIVWVMPASTFNLRSMKDSVKIHAR
jgi:hypothetical protein